LAVAQPIFPGGIAGEKKLNPKLAGSLYLRGDSSTRDQTSYLFTICS
jgi:hypothetical protein